MNMVQKWSKKMAQKWTKNQKNGPKARKKSLKPFLRPKTWSCSAPFDRNNLKSWLLIYVHLKVTFQFQKISPKFDFFQIFFTKKILLFYRLFYWKKLPVVFKLFSLKLFFSQKILYKKLIFLFSKKKSININWPKLIWNEFWTRHQNTDRPLINSSNKDMFISKFFPKNNVTYKNVYFRACEGDL